MALSEVGNLLEQEIDGDIESVGSEKQADKPRATSRRWRLRVLRTLDSLYASVSGRKARLEKWRTCNRSPSALRQTESATAPHLLPNPIRPGPRCQH